MQLDNVGKREPILGGRAHVLHTGTAFGIVHPKHPQFTEQLARLLVETRQSMVLAPKLAFNTRVTPIGGLSELELGQGMKDGKMVQGPNFYRTREASDGVVVSCFLDTRLKIAVLIMNADCGVITILAPNGQMAVLHGGLNNVVPADGSSSIVENAIRHFEEQGFEPSQLQFRVGEAARACCYGPSVIDDERLKLLKREFPDLVRMISNPPREGLVGLDVPAMAARQAEELGVRDPKVEDLCTSCHGLSPEDMAKLDTQGTWYSHLRKGQPKAAKEPVGYEPRNAVVVYSAMDY